MKIMSKAKAAWYQQQRDNLQARLKEQQELLPRLKEDYAVVTDPAVKFEREKQIDRAKDEIKKFTEDVELLANALATGDDSKIPEQCKPKPDEKNPARKKQLDLLDNVKKGWIEGVLRQSLHNEVLIELKKTQDEAAVDRLQQNQPLNVTRVTDEAKPEQAVLLEDDIQEIYEEGKRTLLILGAPGAGKTISLLELTHRLAEDAEFDASQPIPMVFNLSSWAEKQQPLQDWLLDELWNKYRVSNKMGRECLEKDALVLLLDGLDEVAAGQRDACVQAINIYREKYAQKGIVVACRIQEYRELADKLKLEQALCVQPLTEEQIKNYLAAGGEELAGLRTALESDEALQELASSPLMLSMMCLAYQHQTAEAVLEDVAGTAETRRTKLFAAYVQSMFQRPRRGAVEYTEEQTRRWLTYLAYNMQKHGQTIFQMENLQPSWLLTKGGHWLYMMLSRGGSGLLATVGMLLLILFPGRVYLLTYLLKCLSSFLLLEKNINPYEGNFMIALTSLLIMIATETVIRCKKRVYKNNIELFLHISNIALKVSFSMAALLILISNLDINSVIFIVIIFISDGLLIGLMLWTIRVTVNLLSRRIFNRNNSIEDIKSVSVLNFKLKIFIVVQTIGVVFGMLNFILKNNSPIMLYDTTGDKQILFDKQIVQVEGALFSRNGKLIVSKDAKGRGVLWTRDGRKLNELGGNLWLFGFSPDSTLIVTVENDGERTLWTQDGRKIDKLGSELKGVEFSPDSSLIAAVYADKKGVLWTRDGRKLNELGGNLKYVEFSPDSSLIAAVYADKKGLLWTRDGRKLNELGRNLKYVKFSPDSSLIATINADGEGALWTQGGGKPDELGGNLKYVEFSPDSSLIAAIYADGKGVLLTRDGRMIRELGKRLGDWFEFSPDSSLIASKHIFIIGESTLFTRDGYEIRRNLKYVEFSPDSSLIATINADGEGVLLTRGGMKANELGRNLQYIKFSPDSSLIAAVYADKKGMLLTRDGKKINELGGNLKYIEFSPDGKYVLLLRYNFGPVIVTAWIFISFIAAILASLRFNVINPSKKIPNESIWQTLGSGLLLGIVFGVIAAFIFEFIEWQLNLLGIGLTNAFVLGILCGLPVAMWFGLLDFLKHFTLRFVLWLYGYAPWIYARFLDHATDRLFLRKVGGGYIFVHRLLLEYFAADETQLNLLFKKKTPQQQA